MQLDDLALIGVIRYRATQLPRLAVVITVEDMRDSYRRALFDLTVITRND